MAQHAPVTSREPVTPRERNLAGRRKILAGAAALVIEGGLIAALVSGLAQKFVRSITEPNLAVTTIVTPAPSPTPSPRKVSKPAGSAAPAGAKAKDKVAPAPEIPLSQPSPAATAAGNAAAGAGSGSGGSGSGSGAGAGGSGAGSGIASGPQRVAGSVSDRDYPRDAGRAGGTVGVSFRVRSDGAVDQCRVLASSGSVRLDGLTCSLVQQRFRYRPAQDAAGQPVDATLLTTFTYGPR